MSSTFKNIALFIFGAIAGAGAGYMYANKKYEERLNKEIESLKKVYAEYHKLEENKENPSTFSDQFEPDVIEKKAPDHPVEEIDEDSDQMTTDYTKFAARYNKELKEGDLMPEDPNDIPYYPQIAIKLDENPSEPVVIDEDEFYEVDEEEYTKLILYLYDSGEITEDNYDPITEVDKVVKEEDLSDFVKNEDEEELYVKVESRKVIYCIEKQHETWEEMLDRHPVIAERYQ